MKDARAFFDAIARRYDRDYALSGVTSRARMKRVVDELAGKRRVLVLGVGTGRELPALLDAGHEPVGIDISPEMIALCNRRSRTIPITEGDFWQSLPFPDASFDAAIALHGTLAHPPHDRALASLSEEIARVLGADGLFLAEVPSADGLARLAPREGMSIAKTGATTFVHRDETAGVAIEGVALSAEDWRANFAPHLEAKVEPLGDAEVLVLASRPRPRR
jgi:SAM-dependent methyltransferase